MTVGDSSQVSMDACLAVEKEIDRVLSKFGDINGNAGRILSDLVSHIERIKAELENGKSLRETSQSFPPTQTKRSNYTIITGTITFQLRKITH